VKKITFYRLINLILLAIFVISLIIQNYVPLFDVPLKDYWFPMFCFIVSISMLFRSIIFKSDSSLWLFVNLLLLAVALFSTNFDFFSYEKFWPVLVTIPGIASIIVGIIFKQWFQIKIGLFLTSISAPIFLLTFKLINIWWFVLILVAVLILATIIGKILPERWYVNKK
jgi:hypothetical protein